MLAEAVRKFDDEAKWKDSLDSKSLNLLGFNAIFVALLATASTFAEDDTGDVASYLWLPVLFQVVSTLLLLRVVSVCKIELGPSIVDVFKERKNLGEKIVEEVTVHYIGSLLANRVIYSSRVVLFQFAVLLTAVSIVQLTIGLLAFLGSSSIGGGTIADLFKWVPGVLLIAISGTWTAYEHLLAHRELKEELKNWESA